MHHERDDATNCVQLAVTQTDAQVRLEEAHCGYKRQLAALNEQVASLDASSPALLSTLATPVKSSHPPQATAIAMPAASPPVDGGAPRWQLPAATTESPSLRSAEARLQQLQAEVLAHEQQHAAQASHIPDRAPEQPAASSTSHMGHWQAAPAPLEPSYRMFHGQGTTVQQPEPLRAVATQPQDWQARTGQQNTPVDTLAQSSGSDGGSATLRHTAASWGGREVAHDFVIPTTVHADAGLHSATGGAVPQAWGGHVCSAPALLIRVPSHR